MGLLENVKKSLLIPLEETYADDELNSYIEACIALILSTSILRLHPVNTGWQERIILFIWNERKKRNLRFSNSFQFV